MGVFSTDATFKHALEGAPEASPDVAYASLRPEALGQGWGVVCPRLAEGQLTRKVPHARKKVVVHMHRTTRHRERAPHELRARTHGAHV